MQSAPDKLTERARGGGGWLALVIYALVAVVVTFPLVLHLSSALAQKSVDAGLPFGDINFYLWFFWWVKKALFQIHSSLLFTPYQAFPHGLDLTFTTLCLLDGFASLALQPFCSSICIYNVFFVASLTLAAFFTFLLIRELGGEWRGALLGGFIFSYSPFFFFHYAHLNLISIYWVPLTLFFVARMIGRRNLLYVPLASLGLVGTALCDWYNLVYLVLLLLLWLGYGLWTSGREQVGRREREVRRVVVCVALACVVVGSFAVVAAYLAPLPFFLYFLYVFYRRRSEPEANVHARTIALFIVCSVLFLLPYGYPVLTKYLQGTTIVQVPLEAKIYFSAEPLSFFVPEWGWNWVWRLPLRRATDCYGAQFPRELEQFPGFVCMGLLVLLLVIGGRKRKCGFWLFAAPVFAVFALGPVLKWFAPVTVAWLPNRVIALPAVIFHGMLITEGMRVYARFGIVVLLCLSVFIGCNLEALRERLSLKGRRYGLVALLLCVLAVAEKSSLPMRLARVEVPPVYSALRAIRPGGAILAVPFSHDSTYLFLQTIHEHPLVNSYVSRGDEETRAFYDSLYLYRMFHNFEEKPFSPDLSAPELRRRLLEERRNLRIDFFIVHKQYLKPRSVGALRSLFGDFLAMRLAFKDRSVLIFGDEEIAVERDAERRP
jgi:hypothetical protein